jgi:hypothetical protein
LAPGCPGREAPAWLRKAILIKHGLGRKGHDGQQNGGYGGYENSPARYTSNVDLTVPETIAPVSPGDSIYVTWVNPSGQRTTSSLQLTAGPPQ